VTARYIRWFHCRLTCMQFGVSPQADGSNNRSRLIDGIRKVVGRDKLVACFRSLVAPDVITGLQVRVSVFRVPRVVARMFTRSLVATNFSASSPRNGLATQPFTLSRDVWFPLPPTAEAAGGIAHASTPDGSPARTGTALEHSVLELPTIANYHMASCPRPSTRRENITLRRTFYIGGEQV
jgi:hypothetical protein